MEFASGDKMGAIQPLLEALFKHVLDDEEPLFVSDEATMLDVSASDPEELLRRCSEYYKTSVTFDDVRKPLCRLLPELESRRLGSN